jgi:hypothetical protein
MKKIWILLILFVFESNFAQVGIGTTAPSEALDVIGKIRVTDTDDFGRTMTSIIGVDGNGVLGKMALSPDFVINDNIISVSGTTSYSVKDINLYVDIVYPEGHPLAGDPIFVEGDDIVNLDIGANTTNAHETVIRFIGQTQAFDISGITGGVAGRHILLLNPTPFAMGVINEDGGSDAKNRILTYANNVASTEGQGAIELVYDGDRWILLNIRD